MKVWFVGEEKRNIHEWNELLNILGNPLTRYCAKGKAKVQLASQRKLQRQDISYATEPITCFLLNKCMQQMKIYYANSSVMRGILYQSPIETKSIRQNTRETETQDYTVNEAVWSLEIGSNSSYPRNVNQQGKKLKKEKEN